MENGGVKSREKMMFMVVWLRGKMGENLVGPRVFSLANQNTKFSYWGENWQKIFGQKCSYHKLLNWLDCLFIYCIFLLLIFFHFLIRTCESIYINSIFHLLTFHLNKIKKFFILSLFHLSTKHQKRKFSSL